MIKKVRSLTMQTKMILLICLVVFLALFVAHLLITRTVEDDIRKEAALKANDIAQIAAQSPLLIENLQTADNESMIQNYAESLKEAARVEFVVVFDMDGMRKSHPDYQKIGQHLVGGDEMPVFRGQSYVSSAEGTLGRSIRAWRPIYDLEHKQIGGVVVGILLSDVDRSVARSQIAIYWAMILALITGIIGAVLLSRSIKKTLLGLEPSEIARLIEERSAILQSVREGILAIDKDGRLTVVNDEARRILTKSGILGNPLGQPVDEWIPHTRLREVVQSGLPEFDQEQEINDTVILTNRIPLKDGDKVVGAMATFRDLTEIRKLAEELTGVNRYAEALRSQAHEFLNKLHVIFGLVRNKNYDHLAEYLAKVVEENQAEVEFVNERIQDPILAGFLLSKLSRGRELGATLRINPISALPPSPSPEVTYGLVTLLGNLIDNAFDAVQHSSKKIVEVTLKAQKNEWLIQISDSGSGLSTDQVHQIFAKGWSSKGEGRGLGLFLVGMALEKLNGKIEVTTALGQGMTFSITLPINEIEK